MPFITDAGLNTMFFMKEHYTKNGMFAYFSRTKRYKAIDNMRLEIFSGLGQMLDGIERLAGYEYDLTSDAPYVWEKV